MLSATTSTLLIATTKVARPSASPPQKKSRAFGSGTSSVVSFVVAMNRVDVVDLVVDLVDLDLDVDRVDVELAVSLCDGPRSVLFSLSC